MAIPIELPLFVLLVATAVLVARLEDLFAAGMLTGIFSLLSAGLFTLMDAVDVAFTEAAVGAGITTVLILGALSVTSRKEDPQGFRWVPFLVVCGIGAVLIYGTFDMPRYGDPTAPIHQYLAPDLIEGSASDLHIPNVVTAVLGSYRGYDTLGETVVVFTAAVGVMMLLGGLHRRSGVLEDAPGEVSARRPMTMSEKVILNVISRFMIPFILLFALYVQFHGDFGPGGGFQAGVIFAAGIILFALIFGLETAERVLPPRMVESAIALGVLLFGGVGLATVLLGKSFLDYDALSAAHGQHYGIILIELGVGLTVAAAMTKIFYSFAGLTRDV